MIEKALLHRWYCTYASSMMIRLFKPDREYGEKGFENHYLGTLKTIKSYKLTVETKENVLFNKYEMCKDWGVDPNKFMNVLDHRIKEEKKLIELIKGLEMIRSGDKRPFVWK